jgi:hypothetical protein
MMNTRRLLLGLGSVAIVLTIGGAALANGIGITQRSEVEYMTDGPVFADVAELTKASRGVAHVRVLSASESYLVPFDKASAVVSAPPSDGGAKDKARDEARAIPGIGDPSDGVLKTDFTVEVLDDVSGRGPKKGEKVVVSQLGGTLATKRPDGVSEDVIVANAEHDGLMQVGTEEIVFLSQDPSSGKFFTTGGGLGRFSIQSNGTVLAVDHDSPLARAQNGKPIDSLKKAVQSSQ